MRCFYPTAKNRYAYRRQTIRAIDLSLFEGHTVGILKCIKGKVTHPLISMHFKILTVDKGFNCDVEWVFIKSGYRKYLFIKVKIYGQNMKEMTFSHSIIILVIFSYDPAKDTVQTFVFNLPTLIYVDSSVSLAIN